MGNGLEIGVAGYDRWKLDGGGTERHAVGLEGSYFWPAARVGLNLAGYQEYSAGTDFEGYLVRAVLTKAL